MTNVKKLGLTALAGSLVATSVVAGELAVTGGASIDYTSNLMNKIPHLNVLPDAYFPGGEP